MKHRQYKMDHLILKLFEMFGVYVRVWHDNGLPQIHYNDDLNQAVAFKRR